jgi:hypothetical protein
LGQRAIVIPTSDEQEDLAMLFEGIVRLGPHSPIMVEGRITDRLLSSNRLPQRLLEALANVRHEVDPL